MTCWGKIPFDVHRYWIHLADLAVTGLSRQQFIILLDLSSRKHSDLSSLKGTPKWEQADQAQTIFLRHLGHRVLEWYKSESGAQNFLGEDISPSEYFEEYQRLSDYLNMVLPDVEILVPPSSRTGWLRQTILIWAH